MVEFAVTVIIVTHNSAEVIADCLHSIPKTVPIIVVDNASHDSTLAIAQEVCSRATIIDNAENLGFGRANNLALEQVKTPFALLFNPDARLSDGALDALLEAASRHPDAAIIAPTIQDSDGRWKQSCKTSVLQPNISDPLKLADVKPEGDICTDFLSGAAWLMRMEHFKTIGFFDPEIFMFYEDDDLCIRAKAAGHSLVLVRDAVVTHFMGKSSPATAYYIWKKNWHILHSRVYIERKYKGHKAAVQIRLNQGFKYIFKGILYSLACNKTKAIRSWARGFGSFGILKG